LAETADFVWPRLTAPPPRPPDPPHRNLSTRTRMFELLLQTFWAKKTLVNGLLISTLDKLIYYNGTFLLGSTKPLFT
jgi:hypothetical protein